MMSVNVVLIFLYLMKKFFIVSLRDFPVFNINNWDDFDISITAPLWKMLPKTNDVL